MKKILLSLMCVAVILGCDFAYIYLGHAEKSEKETNPSVLTTVESSNIGWCISTAVIDEHKYIIVSTCRGVAICPAKED